MKPYLEVGKVVGTHGVRGEMRVEPWCDSPEFLTKLKKLYLNEGDSTIKVTSSRVQKSMVLLKVQGIDSIPEAEQFRGTILYMDRKDAKLPKDRYFIQDLLGLTVVDADNETVYGKLSDIFPTGANDVYEVEAENGNKYLLPAIPDVIIQVDLKQEKMMIRPIKGIFDNED